MNNVIDFLISPVGQKVRTALGILVIWWGFWGGAGVLVGILGFVPFIAGLANFCLIGPFFGRTIWGKLRVAKGT